MGRKAAVLRIAVAAILCVFFAVLAFRATAAQTVSHGRLEVLNGYTVVSLEGTPEDMGTAYGQLLGRTIQRVVSDVITDDFGRDPEYYSRIRAASKVMERYQPKEYLAELHALAKAAKVSYDDLLLLQYFGDVPRGISGVRMEAQCTSFAILPPNTRDKVCLVGRNFDFFDHGVGEYASVLIYYRPAGKIPFVTVTWAGIINGWTLLNANGVLVSNNTSHEGRNSLEGMSTSFLLRHPPAGGRRASMKESI